jgi:hypothetical protein
MNYKLAGVLGFCAWLLLGWSASTVAKEAPTAKLVQIEGSVEYTRNGTKWRPVRRTKYLFPGYQIRTAEDASGKLVSQTTGMVQELGEESHIEVGIDSIKLIAGSLSEPEEESGSIFQALVNKFARAQRYTTVRRSANQEEGGCNPKVRTIKKLTLSNDYPDLVWRNACPEYSYRLVINGNPIDVPAQSTAEMIRYTVSDVAEGEHTYHVEVLDVDGVVFNPNKDSTFTWSSAADAAKLKQETATVDDDVFLLTDILESREMYVAAMDAYREYFSENPDDNDMRPLLIKSYNDLKLSNLKESEARLYNASLEDDY